MTSSFEFRKNKPAAETAGFLIPELTTPIGGSLSFQ